MICEKCNDKRESLFIQKTKALCFCCLKPKGGNADSIYSDTYVKYGPVENGVTYDINGCIAILKEK